MSWQSVLGGDSYSRWNTNAPSIGRQVFVVRFNLVVAAAAIALVSAASASAALPEKSGNSLHATLTGKAGSTPRVTRMGGAPPR